MKREDLAVLLTANSLRLLTEFADLETTRDALGAVAKLRRAGVDAQTSTVVLEQLGLRKRASAKFGDFAANMLFTDAGLAQATRLSVAAQHAQRFRAAQVSRIADLGCGIGADSLAFAALGFEVHAVDVDEVTAALASFNLASFPNVRVSAEAAESVDLSEVDGVWLDPARRRGERRRLHPDDWQPSLEFAFGTATAHRSAGVKLAPAMPHELLPEQSAKRPVEAQWVSVAGELVECTVWLGATARDGVRRSALVLREGQHELVSAAASSEDAPLGELSDWLYEPDPAVIRGRFIGDVARSLDGHMIAPEIAWITADHHRATPFAQAFRVREVLPLRIPPLKRRLRELEIGSLEVKKRGVDIEPAKLRSQLGLRGSERATLICTRVGDRHVAILADRAQASQP